MQQVVCVCVCLCVNREDSEFRVKRLHSSFSLVMPLKLIFTVKEKIFSVT